MEGRAGRRVDGGRGGEESVKRYKRCLHSTEVKEHNLHVNSDVYICSVVDFLYGKAH